MKRVVIGTSELPKHDPKIAIFGCIDPRLTIAYRDLLEDTFGILPGQYFNHLAKGAVNCIIHDSDAVRVDSYETVKLLLDKGVHTFYLMPHTCCAGDSKMNFESIEADLSFQERKIMDAVSKVRQYAKSLNVPLTIKPYILNLTATNVEHIAFADDGKENIGIHYTAPFPQEQAAGV